MLRNKSRLYRITGIICFFGILWLGFLHFTDADTTLCPIKRVTGYPCPSCGSSRSIAAFLHGDFSHALLINPLGVISLFMLISVLVLLIIDLLLKKDYYYRTYSYIENFLKTHRVISLILGLLILANWIWNISKGL